MKNYITFLNEGYSNIEQKVLNILQKLEKYAIVLSEEKYELSEILIKKPYTVDNSKQHEFKYLSIQYKYNKFNGTNYIIVYGIQKCDVNDIILAFKLGTHDIRTEVLEQEKELYPLYDYLSSDDIVPLIQSSRLGLM